MVTLAPVHPEELHDGLLCSDSLREPEKDLRRPNELLCQGAGFGWGWRSARSWR